MKIYNFYNEQTQFFKLIHFSFFMKQHNQSSYFEKTQSFLTCFRKDTIFQHRWDLQPLKLIGIAIISRLTSNFQLLWSKHIVLI